MLNFQHVSPVSPQKHIHLFMGSGLGWADFDRDGRLDLLFCQGAPAETMHQNPLVPSPPSAGERVRVRGASEALATSPSLPQSGKTEQTREKSSNRIQSNTPALALWRNDGDTFTDHSPTAGFHGTAYALGMTLADYDNDGFTDLFATGLFAAALYHNNGDGTFSDETAAAGIVPHGFGSGCCWLDWDRDGALDLVYVRYIAASPEHYPLCKVTYNQREVAVSCNPRKLKGDADSLYRNLGDGLFQDVTQGAAFATTPPRQGLGCVALDLDDDGETELYVANDTSPNDLWRTEASGGRKPPVANSKAYVQLEEVALIAGAAVNRSGTTSAGMGIAAGDIDGDLRPDLYVTNYFHETNTLYRNEGGLSFLDVTEELGIAAPSRLRLGFGVTLADFDNDGWSDYLVANGHVQDALEQVGIKEQPFEQLSQVLQNQRGKRFVDVSAKGGPFFQTPTVARGTAAADVDGDGRVDVAVLRLNRPAALLHNETKEAGRWLSVELQGTTSNRDGIGATVIVETKGQSWRRDRMSSASYLSCDAPALHFGLGTAERIERVRVRWPSGLREEFREVAMNATVRLVEGSGTVTAKR